MLSGSNVEPCCRPFHHVKALALPLPVGTSNAGSPTRCIGMSPRRGRAESCPQPRGAVHNTPHRALPLLCF